MVPRYYVRRAQAEYLKGHLTHLRCQTTKQAKLKPAGKD